MVIITMKLIIIILPVIIFIIIITKIKNNDHSLNNHNHNNHNSPVEKCKNWGFWVKGTKASTIVACYILNETGYRPPSRFNVMSLPWGILLFWPLFPYKRNKFKNFCSEFQK